ncbi:hypothetical protein PHLCEN_2v636 [Hermanssonia centrifuga]|uniref:Uncharacterized protein n=1 Tax=Hermanssonia centrifuga TaxID=98765 RepID=A0A2R6S5I9_9APHY|nr:hypothetical protein PHLCEN_2v636 [Hermanssonia centrifuga]
MYYAISKALLLYSAYRPGSWAFFNPLHHSGPASPYFDAPSVFGIPFETPAGCIVEKAAYIVRHGATAGQQRVIDTATHFLRGYLSQGDYLSAPEFNRGNLVILPDSVNTTGADSLTASAACPAYSGNDGTSKSNAFRATYQNGIANRLNRFLDGIVLDATDIGVMQDLCGFSFVINGDRRFCDIFQGSVSFIDISPPQD